MRKKENPNHRMGKQTGYELINGEYHIASLYQEQFTALNFKAEGIKSMLNIVTQHASDDLEEIAKQRQKIFNEMADDIGIDLKDGWNYCNGVLRPVKKPEEKKASDV
jgi:hypothetical protein